MYKCVCGYTAPYSECVVNSECDIIEDRVICPKCDSKMQKMTIKVKRIPLSPMQPIEASK